jgi:polyphenol oxidase
VRCALKLPKSFSSQLFDKKSISHAFFTKVGSENDSVDFSAPLSLDLAESLIEQFGLKKLLVLNQNHTQHVVRYPSSCGYSFSDGIITKEKKVGLLIRHADCQAALFYDPKTGSVGACHAGYKGQVLGIYSHLIHKMQAEFHVRPQDLLVALSPSLGFCHAEFINYKTEFPNKWHSLGKDNYFDLKQIAFDELIQNGVSKDHIDISPLCTFDDEKLFYSYRRDKTKKRLASFICIN